jgi:hypothetical protein
MSLWESHNAHTNNLITSEKLVEIYSMAQVMTKTTLSNYVAIM